MQAFTTPILLSTKTSLSLNGISARRRSRSNRFSVVPRATASVPVTENGNTESFGRGERFPRRLVGLYELERLGVDPNKMLAPNKSAERGLGALVGLGVLATFAVPLISPWVQAEGPVALIIAGVLTLWAVDTLALSGLLQRAASIQVQNARRIALHEAGHFLVAHLLGLKVSSYSVPSARSVLNGDKLGVEIEQATDGDAYTLAALGMAGIAAECSVYGESQGGAEDFAQVTRVAKNSGALGQATEQQKTIIVRWGLIQAVSLVKAHTEALEKLTTAMMNNKDVSECVRIIDESVDSSALRLPIKQEIA